MATVAGKFQADLANMNVTVLGWRWCMAMLSFVLLARLGNAFLHKRVAINNASHVFGLVSWHHFDAFLFLSRTSFNRHHLSTVAALNR